MAVPSRPVVLASARYGLDLTALKTVWLATWDQLPDLVHQAFSSKRVPYKAVLTGMFPTAFSELDPKLRTYKAYSRNPPVSDDEAALIRATVAGKMSTLVAAARNYLLLDVARDGDDFGLSNPRESLSGFAWVLAVEEGEIQPEMALPWLETRYPPAATLKNLQRALADPEIVDEIEAALALAVPYGESGLPEPGPEIDRAVQVLMCSAQLADLEASTQAPDDLGKEQAAWTDLLDDAGLPSIHGAVKGLVLAHQVPVPKAGLFEPAPRPLERSAARGTAIMPPPRQLEVSLVDRLRRALDTDRARLEGLTPRSVLRAEVTRSVSPLGLSSPGAQAVFVLLREVSMEIGSTAALKAKRGEALAIVKTPPGTALGQSFARVFDKFKAAKATTARYARVGETVLATLDDPTQAYTSEVWGRVHGHDVRGTLDFSDLATVFTKVLLGVRESLLRTLSNTHDDAILLHDPETQLRQLEGSRALDDDLSGVAVVKPPPGRTRHDALAEFLTVVTKLSASGTAGYGEVQTFVANADADPAYRTTWDRWSKTSGSPPWLTYDVVVTVIPLMRRDPEGM